MINLKLLVLIFCFVKILCFSTLNSGVVISAIAKGEEPYLHEWIAYHIGIGFDHIFLADNSDDGTLNSFLLSPDSPSARFYPHQLTIFHNPGKLMQFPTYSSVIDLLRKTDNWIAFLDIDEFIVLHKHNKIKEMMYECTLPFDHRGALALNWVLFGSNGHTRHSTDPVTKRFTKRQKSLNHHVKTIAYVKDTDSFRLHPYTPVMLNNASVYDCSGNILATPYNYAHINQNSVSVDGRIESVKEDGEYRDNASDSVAVIHHYMTKSYDEFVQKTNKGFADHVGTRNLADFTLYDLNEIEDFTAYEKYCSIIGKDSC